MQASDWTQGQSILENEEPFHLLILDPAISGFRAETILSLIAASAPQKSKLVLLSSSTGHGVWQIGEDLLAEQLDVGGKIDPHHTKSHITFILNRVLHPELMNQRKYPRALMECDVEYYHYKDRKKKRRTTFTLGAGGAFLATSTPETARRFIRLSIALPGERRAIECSARVVYVCREDAPMRDFFPAGMGVRFSDLTEEGREKIVQRTYPQLLRVDQLQTAPFV